MINYIFSNHVSYYVSSLGLNYSGVFGFILVLLFFIQFLSGLFLTLYYSSYYKISFYSIFYLTYDVHYGYIFRIIHILGSALFIFFIYFHFLRSF